MRTTLLPKYNCRLYINMVIALDDMHSSAVFSLFGFFFCQVAVGVGESDARAESAPAQTSPQQAELGSDRPSACWRSVLVVQRGSCRGGFVGRSRRMWSGRLDAQQQNIPSLYEYIWYVQLFTHAAVDTTHFVRVCCCCNNCNTAAAKYGVGLCNIMYGAWSGNSIGCCMGWYETRVLVWLRKDCCRGRTTHTIFLKYLQQRQQLLPALTTSSSCCCFWCAYTYRVQSSTWHTNP